MSEQENEMRVCASENCKEPAGRDGEDRCPLCRAEDTVYPDKPLSPREQIKVSLSRLRRAEEKHQALCEKLSGQETDSFTEEIIEMGLEPVNTLHYPVEITGVEHAGLLEWQRDNAFHFRKPGTFVNVRPCDEEYEGKTFFGIFLGDLPISLGVSYDDETGLLHAKVGHGNPAIFVPAIGKIIFGCGSWWGPIKTPEDVGEITDDDIQNLWYMKAINAQLAEAEAADKAAGKK